jgi:glycosyltransferase involved in cell wall biosynthesis
VTEASHETAATSERPAQTGAIVPQHLVLVLPATGEFDSRSYRIARELISRGHRVTMLARWKAGLPFEEDDPSGYRIVRIMASSADGLPFRRVRGLVGRAVRRQHALRTGVGPRRSGTPLTPGGEAASPSEGAESPDGAVPTPVHRASLPRRLWAAVIRRLAIPLTLRSHIRNAREAGVTGDLYHGMAYMGIPVALDLGGRDRVPVVYDARDIYLEARNLARSRGIVRWAAARAERGWAARSARVITVNDAYADVMEQRLRVERPLVVMNCSYRYEPAEPRERRFNERFGLDPATKIVLYHGGLFPHRGIEELFEAMTGLPDSIDLVLMGYGVLEPEFRRRAAEAPWRGRVHMMNAVPPAELLDWVACADVAAMPIQASTLNHRLTTPNKLFEAMAAGVPAVVSDLPGMATIVTETGSGLLVDPADPVAIRRAIEEIASLDEAAWLAWRRRCLAAAHDRYSWETQVGRLIEEYGRLTGHPW